MLLAEKSACDEVIPSMTLMSSYKQKGNLATANYFIFRVHLLQYTYLLKSVPWIEEQKAPFAYFISRLPFARVSTSVE